MKKVLRNPLVYWSLLTAICALGPSSAFGARSLFLFSQEPLTESLICDLKLFAPPLAPSDTQNILLPKVVEEVNRAPRDPQDTERLANLLYAMPQLETLELLTPDLRTQAIALIQRKELLFRRVVYTFILQHERLPSGQIPSEKWLADACQNLVELPGQIDDTIPHPEISIYFKADPNLATRAKEFERDHGVEAAEGGLARARLNEKTRNDILLSEFRARLSIEVRVAVEIYIADDPKLLRKLIEITARRYDRLPVASNPLEKFAAYEIDALAYTRHLAPHLLSKRLNKLLLARYPERILLEESDYSGLSSTLRASGAPFSEHDKKVIVKRIQELITAKSSTVIQFATHEGDYFRGIPVSVKGSRLGTFRRLKLTFKDLRTGEHKMFRTREIDFASLTFGEGLHRSVIQAAPINTGFWAGIPIESRPPAHPVNYRLAIGRKAGKVWEDLKAGRRVDRFASHEERVLKRLIRVFRLLEEDPRHVSLHTHEIDSLSERADFVVFESYIDNRSAITGRLFWRFGPEPGQITIIGMGAHPDNDKAYARIEIDTD